MNNTFVHFHIFHPEFRLHSPHFWLNNIYIHPETRLFHPFFIQGCCCTGRTGKGLQVAQPAERLASPSLLLCFLFFHKRCAQFVFSTSRFLVREEDTGFALSWIPICWNLTKICAGGGGFFVSGCRGEERVGTRESVSRGSAGIEVHPSVWSREEFITMVHQQGLLWCSCYCHSPREEFMSFLGFCALFLDLPCMSSSALWKTILI